MLVKASSNGKECTYLSRSSKYSEKKRKGKIQLTYLIRHRL